MAGWPCHDILKRLCCSRRHGAVAVLFGCDVAAALCVCVRARLSGCMKHCTRAGVPGMSVSSDAAICIYLFIGLIKLPCTDRSVVWIS